MKKFICLILVLSTFLFAGCSDNSDSEETAGNGRSVKLTSEENSDTAQTEAEEQTAEENGAEYTFGSTFTFDDLEITIGETVESVFINNQFSDKNGQEVIKLPIKVKNISDKTHGLNMFYYTFFGSQGLKLDGVSSYFDNAVDSVGDMRPGAECDAYMYLLYDGDGDYYITFDNFSDTVDVKLPITK